MLPIKGSVGVLGGGQLGRMMGFAAHRLGIRLVVVDPEGIESPAGKVTGVAVKGAFNDAAKVSVIVVLLNFNKNVMQVRELGEQCAVVTTEIEHVNAEGLEQLEKAGVRVEPSSRTIRLIQDKFLQKQHLQKRAVPLSDFVAVSSELDIQRAGEAYGYPLMLKSRRLAYDGRGNYVVNNEKEINKAFTHLGGGKGNELYVERWVKFDKELAVMVARSTNGQLASYTVVETVQKDNICHTVTAPARITSTAAKEAQRVAELAVSAVEGAGIFGVELFLLSDGRVLYNEMAPRPHNSGHFTIEACVCDQFEQHLRAVTGLPLGDSAMKVGAACMVNVLGLESFESTLSACNLALRLPGASVHWYGKGEWRKGRKMGHITVVGASASVVQQQVDRILAAQHTGADKESKESKTDSKDRESKGKDSDAGLRCPLVGVIMGSDSDLPCMKDAAEILDKFRVPYELTIVSAHRTPERMFEYAKNAHKRGLKVIIAGAGGAAHLPGMVASLTPLPVVGVPVKSAALSGQDSLLSIVQMPKGIPVATVAIHNAANAGLLAVRMLSSFDVDLQAQLIAYHDDMRNTVETNAAALEKSGYKSYLQKMEDKEKAADPTRQFQTLVRDDLARVISAVVEAPAPAQV